MKILDFLKSLFRKIEILPHKEKLKARIIFNPLAGDATIKKSMRDIRNSFSKIAPNIEINVAFSRAKGDMSNVAKHAKKEGYDMVIVAGGDGAINEVVQGLAEEDIPLAIIPLGTGNVFAEEIGIPKNIEGAVKIIAENNIKRVDLGKAQTRYFLWMLGIGADALVAEEVHASGIKEKLGNLAYFSFAIKHLKQLPYFSCNLQIDEKKINFNKILAVIVGNACTYDGKKIKIKSTESMDDGFLDVIVAQKVGIVAVLRQIFYLIIGRRTYYKKVDDWTVKYFRAKTIKIETNPPQLFHTDGEVIGKTPIEISIVPQALSIILPKTETTNL